MFCEDDGLEVDALDEDDDEESQEQNALNKEKKLEAKKLANEVEMNLCCCNGKLQALSHQLCNMM
jgi:hypothetical protein